MQSVSRQMLHAWRLVIFHPRSEKAMHLQAPVASDMNGLLDSLAAVRVDSL